MAPVVVPRIAAAQAGRPVAGRPRYQMAGPRRPLAGLQTANIRPSKPRPIAAVAVVALDAITA